MEIIKGSTRTADEFNAYFCKICRRPMVKYGNTKRPSINSKSIFSGTDYQFGN